MKRNGCGWFIYTQKPWREHMDKPENMTGVLAVPMPSERRQKELALAGLLQIAIDMIRNTGPSDLDIRIENAKDMIREFKHVYPEAREI